LSTTTHGSDFSLDRVPTFSIGVRDEYEQADEGFGIRPLPRVNGDAEFSWHLAKEIIYDEFDLTVCQEMKVDHGLMSPLPLLFFPRSRLERAGGAPCGQCDPAPVADRSALAFALAKPLSAQSRLTQRILGSS